MQTIDFSQAERGYWKAGMREERESGSLAGDEEKGTSSESTGPSLGVPELLGDFAVDEACWGRAAARYASSEIEALRGSIDRLSRYSERQGDLIEKLQRENETLRSGELRQALKPIIRDLIRYYDDLYNLSSAWQDNFVDLPEKVLKGLKALSLAVLDILNRHGVEIFQAEPGDSFDRTRHKAFHVLSTGDESKNRTIGRVLQRGFEWDAEVIRPVGVDVFRFEAVKPETAAADGDQTQPDEATLDQGSRPATAESSDEESVVSPESAHETSLEIEVSGESPPEPTKLGENMPATNQSIEECLKALEKTDLYDFLEIPPTSDKAKLQARYSLLQARWKLNSRTVPSPTEELVLRAVQELLVDGDPNAYAASLRESQQSETDGEGNEIEGDEESSALRIRPT